MDDTPGVIHHETGYHPHKSKFYMAIKVPRIVWKGTVATHDRADFNEMTIHISGGTNEAGFDVDNFLPDLTAWIGSENNAEHRKDRGTCRAKRFDGSDLVVSADASCWWVVGDTVCITDLHELWPKPHRVEVEGDEEDPGDVTVWKDMDLEHDVRFEYPIPIFGPPACAFIDSDLGYVDVLFDGSLSYLVQPDSQEYGELGWSNQGIDQWDWWLEGADNTTPSGVQVTARYTAPGQYVARLTVTDLNARTGVGFRNVFIFERTGVYAPITDYKLTQLSGSLDQNGWNATVDVVNATFDPLILPDNTQVVLFSEDWYGVTPRAEGIFDLWGRSNIRMVGWAVTSDASLDSGHQRAATLAVRGLHEYMKGYGNFPVYFTQVDAEAPEWSFFDPDPGHDPLELFTVRKCLYHLIKWHWTLFQFTDVFFPDDHNNWMPGQSFPEGSLASQLDNIVKDIQARWTTDSGGALWVYSWMNWLPWEGGGLSWRTGHYREVLLNEDDIKRVEITPRIGIETARVCVEGVTATGDHESVELVIDTAPGDIRGWVGGTEVLGNQVLGTGGFEGSQGYELARMVYAELTRQYESVKLTLTGNYALFDSSPYACHVFVSLRPAFTFRGINWVQLSFWTIGVELEVDTEGGGVKTTVLTLIPETHGSATTQAYNQYEDIQRDERRIHKKAGVSSGGAAVADLTQPDVKVVPALMGDGAGHLGGRLMDGYCHVRLYGNPAYLVEAVNWSYKVVDNRACLVEMNTQGRVGGRPASATYAVVGVRDALTAAGAVAEVDRGYIDRVPTFSIEGIVIPLIEQCAPLKVMRSTVYARAIHVIAINAPVGGTCILRVFTDNRGLLGTVTLAEDQYDGVLVLDERAEESKLIEGDVLHLFEGGGTATTMPSLVMIEVECREYGL